METRLLERFREKLQRLRREIVAQEIDARQNDGVVREGRTAEYEEAMQDDQILAGLGSLADSLQRRKISIDAALARIDAGTYGACLIDGAPIELDRLEALPDTQLCARHAAEQAFQSEWRAPTPL